MMVPAVTTVPKPESSGKLNCVSDGTNVSKVEAQEEEEAEHEEIVTQEEDGAHECVHDKKEDDFSVTTAAESLGDLNACESIYEGKDYSVMINGTLFTGMKSSTVSSHHNDMVSGNENDIGAEETLKERNRRLLCKEREFLRQRKVKTAEKRGKLSI